ncbi:hypothetical protein P153DRAFT_365955 [Dothidotthia symphoricarpi CBS 119687]|uniref:AGC-kinase C-terminal domain-containing protein n=1 Tax=Dothidotthia symphoricarpi CBS 119687 TaxID=1392245 RepID=A0A6A6AEH1_9PLEO|nr:uncharacterized protein P153DRAFT_365955 [Dothidotthia symphoricarpi CBS 119687]KAF2130342.1 hypothetical protein P153DRAFT_365955 [Dothidotthia symphoricarpi CBS 119687]
MAPSHMFSYLRPGHAKRSALSLTSPDPVSSPTMRPQSQDADYFTSPRFNAPDNASFASSSPISPYPPQLPPITRVASQTESQKKESKASSARPISHRTQSASQSSTHLSPSVISPSYAAHSKSQTSLLLSGISEKLTGGSKATSTPTATKPKSRLSLRNPMSLLSRRRSGPTLDPLADEALVTRRSPTVMPPMPDNYDPRIRGNIVHDFNAPRLNRTPSYDVNGGSSTPQDLDRVSPPKIDRAHTPVFHEHFDDDTSFEQSQANIRAEQLANKDFVARNSVQFLPPSSSPLLPPTIPENSPPAIPQLSSSSPPPPYQAIAVTSSILSPVYEVHSPTDTSPDATPRKRQSSKTLPPTRSRATSVTDPSWQPAGLPAHLSSRASRFSFQIPGSDSTQEQVMEERHKQKAAEKAAKQVHVSAQTLEDEYDEYGMDDYDMDGGFEEDIPMLGEEDEFGGLGDQSMDTGINAFDFSTLSIQPSLYDSMSPAGQAQIPLDLNGNPIGFAVSAEMLRQLQYMVPGGNENTHEAPTDESFEPELVSIQPETPPQTMSSSAPTDNNRGLDDFDFDDDMYFDDGLIGEQEENDAPGFDENVFDDPDGPLYERKAKPPPAEDTQSPLSSNAVEFFSAEPNHEAEDDTVSKHLEKSEPSLAHKTSIAQRSAMPDLNDIGAYHSALADAAHRAEAEGRFSRKLSVDTHQTSAEVDTSSSQSDSHPSLVPDESQYSMNTANYPSYDDEMNSTFMDDYDMDEYDSAMEEDPMIAAANAEALAFDDEGFYGSEFGFYASGVGDAQNTWGGFFGSSGIGRTISGRNAVREPCLTPITERSEYSTRNSFIGLNHFRDGQQPLASPGLAQLARMSPFGGWTDEEDLTLDALRKLRKGAFGGSTVSLPSQPNSPRNSSPIGMQFLPRASSAAGSRIWELNENEPVSDESANISDDYEGNEQDDEGLMDAVNADYGDESDSEEDSENETPESPTFRMSNNNSLSSPASHITTNMPPLLPAAQVQAYQGMSLMSSFGLPLKSASNTPMPISPFAIPLGSPFQGQQHHPASPPPIDTSLSSPSSGPRRQSVGFASPISMSSPLTPNGSGWRGGHSRNGSGADSVTYVREHDEAGEGRWVLERRRTAESGELELIGREIVEGGRI